MLGVWTLSSVRYSKNTREHNVSETGFTLHVKYVNKCIYIYTGPLSVQAQYSRLCPVSSSFRYNEMPWLFLKSRYVASAPTTHRKQPTLLWEVFTATLHISECGAARLGSARLGSTRDRTEKTPLSL
jgi:hypothetical protein